MDEFMAFATSFRWAEVRDFWPDDYHAPAMDMVAIDNSWLELRSIEHMREHEKVWEREYRAIARRKHQRSLWQKVAGTVAVMALVVCCGAATIPERDAVRAIIGEARGEPYAGQVAVACALRNRGTLKGVYGYTARVSAEEVRRAWPRALAAWRESAKRDVTGGAAFWDNVRARPWWAATMRRTLVVGRHAFYAERT